MKATSPLKYHGGKSYLASRIIALMPPRSEWCHYVEPYAGGLSVLLAQDPEGISEVVNDLNGLLINFWKILQDEKSFCTFFRMCEAAPFSEELYSRSVWWLKHLPDPVSADPVEAAFRFFIYCRQSLAGRMTHFAPLSKSRTRRGMNEQTSAWLSAVEGLPAVHARLRRVVILGPKPALEVIGSEDSKQTLFYIDCPYLHETRTSTTEYGEHEMTYEQHAELLDKLRSLESKFLLSGYRSDLYDSYALTNHWTRHEFEISNHAATGGSKRRMTECVWCNF